MPWYHRIATFLNYSLPQMRATRRTQCGPAHGGHFRASCPGHIGVGAAPAGVDSGRGQDRTLRGMAPPDVR